MCIKSHYFKKLFWPRVLQKKGESYTVVYAIPCQIYWRITGSVRTPPFIESATHCLCIVIPTFCIKYFSATNKSGTSLLSNQPDIYQWEKICSTKLKPCVKSNHGQQELFSHFIPRTRSGSQLGTTFAQFGILSHSINFPDIGTTLYPLHPMYTKPRNIDNLTSVGIPAS